MSRLDTINSKLAMKFAMMKDIINDIYLDGDDIIYGGTGEIIYTLSDEYTVLDGTWLSEMTELFYGTIIHKINEHVGITNTIMSDKPTGCDANYYTVHEFELVDGSYNKVSELYIDYNSDIEYVVEHMLPASMTDFVITDMSGYDVYVKQSYDSSPWRRFNK